MRGRIAAAAVITGMFAAGSIAFPIPPVLAIVAAATGVALGKKGGARTVLLVGLIATVIIPVFHAARCGYWGGIWDPGSLMLGEQCVVDWASANATPWSYRHQDELKLGLAGLVIVTSLGTALLSGRGPRIAAANSPVGDADPG